MSQPGSSVAALTSKEASKCEWCDHIAANAGRASEDELLAEYERLWRRQVRDRIDQGGWTVVAVEEWPMVSYTVGLCSRGHAELCVFGLYPADAQAVLNVPNPADVVPLANIFYRRKPRNSVPALQLVYPDVHGVWPWEEDCHLFPGQQPLPGEYPESA